jgi:hypothetical protein
VVLTHPPFSPYLMTNDFYLFLWMKEVLKGCHFKDTAEGKVASRIMLLIIQSGFHTYFKLYEQWHKYVAAEGQYFKSKCILMLSE